MGRYRVAERNTELDTYLWEVLVQKAAMLWH